MNEISELTNGLQNDRPDVKIAIQALGPLGWHTLKSMDTNFSLKDEQEYLNGRVKDETKFTEHYSILVYTFNKPK